MRIALVNNCAPFVRGGAELLVDNLYNKLIEFGHKAQVFRFPFPGALDVRLLEAITSARLSRLCHTDRVIAFKFPAYFVAHPNKVLWMFHQFRQVYELWGTEYGLPETFENQSIREAIIQADNLYLPEAQRIFTNSYEVADRLNRYNGIHSEVLMPPLTDSEKFHCEGYGDYFFFPSRITKPKRQHLAVESMKFTKTGVRLILAGKCEEPAYINFIKGLIRENALEKKVAVLDHWISQEEKISLMSNALACLYIPYLEDSCGFVTMEALYSCKPVITCTDSGGTAELVHDGFNGALTEPNPEKIAAIMDLFFLEREATERMGWAGRQDIVARNITWEHTIQRLTE
jgi:glycosyltransferase involved in cell wall biosynthesis